jgi:alpha-galactosidase
MGFALLAGLASVAASRSQAATELAGERMETQRWVAAHLGGGAAGAVQPPFSFSYGEQTSSKLLGGWKRAYASKPVATSITSHTTAFSDPATGLEICCDAIEYSDFPAVEWVLRLKNNGSTVTPLIKDLQALDLTLTGESSDFVVHHAKGSEAAVSDYSPLSDRLPPNGNLALYSRGIPSGVPSQEAIPMFNVEWDRRGMIAALGWTGRWTASFQREGKSKLRIRGGMDRTCLCLRPGEEIRSPRVLLLFWSGDRDDAHNVWRRLLLAHYSPRPGGKPFTGLICDANWGSCMPAERHVAQINWWRSHDLPMECYWMDAGWTDMSKGWAAHQSQQTPNKALFPDGLCPVSDAARRRGMKFLLWFVPESAWPGVGIAAEHPEWLPKPFTCKEYGDQVFYGLDHGNPQINRFMIDHFSKVISQHGVDVFRHDGTNIWPDDSGPDRAGMGQIRFVTGFYAFWDGLLKNHPDLLIDNCACGGRKLDLETIRRSIVLWRSDCQASGDFDGSSSQAFNQGLFSWIPLCGGAVPMAKPVTHYSFRSAYCPAMVLVWPMTPVADLEKQRWSQVDVDLLRRLLKEYVAVRPYLFGDYYPLMPHSLDRNVWVAWQFDRPDLGEGMVQAFRREKSPKESICVKPRGLDRNVTYVLTNLDQPGTTEMRGRDLQDNGVTIPIAGQPGSAIVVYRKMSATKSLTSSTSP